MLAKVQISGLRKYIYITVYIPFIAVRPVAVSCKHRVKSVWTKRASLDTPAGLPPYKQPLSKIDWKYFGWYYWYSTLFWNFSWNWFRCAKLIDLFWDFLKFLLIQSNVLMQWNCSIWKKILIFWWWLLCGSVMHL